MTCKYRIFGISIFYLAMILATGPGTGIGLADDDVPKGRSLSNMEEGDDGYDKSMRAEDYFDVVGTVNLIESDRVVIGNDELPLAVGARLSAVKKYDHVGALLNEEGEVIACQKLTNEAH